MRVLILSCNTGEGHNSCAAAIQAEFESRGDQCLTMDALNFISEGTSKFVSKWHVRLYRYFPEVFNKGYSFAEEHPSTLDEKSAAKRVLKLGCRKLRRFITTLGFDAVICTHLFPALMMTEIQSHKPLAVKTAFIVTDYTASPTAEDVRTDIFVTPYQNVNDDFAALGIPAESLMPSGIPVRPMFFRHIDKAAAKENAGVNPQRKHLLIMSGSMGCGPIKKILRDISENLPDDCEVTVVCGNNKRLFRRLSDEYAAFGNINIRGYSKNISLLMDSADLYLTKPGGISVTEAASMRLPMVFIDAVAGCEEYNKDFFLRTGGAVTGQTPKEIARTSLRLLSDKDALEKMGDALDAAVPHNAAANILSEMSEAEEEKEEDLA